jgi:hypothetical protein
MQESLAIYAAVLSTILALSKLLPEGPVVFFEPVEGSDPPDARIRIFNPSQRALFIDGCRQIRRAGPHEHFGVVEDRPLHQQEQIARAFMERLRPDGPRQPKLYVAPGQVVTLRVNNIGDGADRVVIIWWHRNWWPLFFVRFPAFARITADLVRLAPRPSRRGSDGPS